MLLLRKTQNVNIGLPDHPTLHPQSTLFSVSENTKIRKCSELDEEFMDCNIEFSLDEESDSKPIFPTLIPPRSAKRSIPRPKENEFDLSNKREEEINIPHTACLPNPSDPHECYLSSEDDVSTSDFNDDLSESEDSDLDVPSEINKGELQETTAKAVSFRIVGKPQIIDINLHPSCSPKTSGELGQQLRSTEDSNQSPKQLHIDEEKPSSPPQELDQVHDRLSPPQLPNINLTPTNLDFKDDDTSTPSNSHPDSTRPGPNVSSHSLPQEEPNLNPSSLDLVSTPPLRKSTLESSIVKPNLLASHGIKAAQPLLYESSKNANTPLGNAWKLSNGFAALKRVSKNIRNNSISKISLAYTPGVVPRRSLSDH